MLLRILATACLLVAAVLNGGCTSQTQLANASTDTFGNWSPVGSEKVTRQRSFTLASQYPIYIAWSDAGPNQDKATALNARFSGALTIAMQRYFLSVQQGAEARTLQAALDDSATAGADILMLVRVDNWPDINPVRVQSCPSDSGRSRLSLQPCTENDKTGKDEKAGSGVMALSVSLYDVRGRKPIDAISAVSQRGMASYVYKDVEGELAQLCALIAGQLTARSAPR